MSVEASKELYLPTHAFVLDLLPSTDQAGGNYRWEGFVKKNCISDYVILLAAEGKNRGPNDDSWSYMSIKTGHGVEDWELRQIGQSEITVILRGILTFSALDDTLDEEREPVSTLESRTIAHLPLKNTIGEKRLISPNDIDLANAVMLRNPVYKSAERMINSFTSWAEAILESAK